MLIEIAAGDAYGVCFEMCDRDEITPANLLKYNDAMPPSFIKRGCYTDDTQMSIAVSECLLYDEDWSALSFANRFVSAFQRDKRRGYTGPFYSILSEVNNGTELLALVKGNSNKGGAAMRSAPCGLFSDIFDVTEYARVQAETTHNSWAGREAAIAVALATHYFVYDVGPKDSLVGWLRDERYGDRLHSPHDFEVDGETIRCWSPYIPRVRTHAWDVLEAALYAVEAHDSMSKILWQCCEYAGDTDTVAAIAMGIASWSKEIKQDLPKALVLSLDANGQYGRKFLEDLDNQLKERFFIDRD